MDQPETLRRRVEIDVDIDRMWRMVSDPALLAGWLGDTVDVRIEPGQTGTITEHGVIKRVHIDRVDQGRAVEFTWCEQDQPAHSSRVVFEISSSPNGTSRLDITETFSSDSSDTSLAGQSVVLAAQWESRICVLWACTVGAALAAVLA